MDPHAAVDPSRLGDVVSRFGLPDATVPRLAALLTALAAEPDPHTTVGPEEAIDVHIADSLSGLEVPELRCARTIADIGAGAGFPGLPLAVARSDARVDLIESARRKTAVIDRLIAAAEIPNARSITVRVEEAAAGEGREAYDAVTARAVGPLPVLVEYAAPLLVSGGMLVAWKGARDADELLCDLQRQPKSTPPRLSQDRADSEPVPTPSRHGRKAATRIVARAWPAVLPGNPFHSKRAPAGSDRGQPARQAAK